MTAWHSLNQLHLEYFSNNLEGVPTYVEHMLAAFPSLCNPTHPKPSQLGWGRGTVEARSSDAALHHSPSWSNSPVGSLSCCNQIIVSLSANQIDGISLRYAVVAMLVKCAAISEAGNSNELILCSRGWVVLSCGSPHERQFHHSAEWFLWLRLKKR